MLIYTNQRSRKRKPTAKQRQLQAEWQELINRTKTISFAQKPSKKVNHTKLHFSADKKTQTTHFSAPKTISPAQKRSQKVNIAQNLSPKPFVRETEYIPSKDTGYYNTFKKADLYYTGDKMKGIGTLHKSNAVPIFTDEEAKDQANMRR